MKARWYILPQYMTNSGKFHRSVNEKWLQTDEISQSLDSPICLCADWSLPDKVLGEAIVIRGLQDM